jgi:hypothetical protein
MKRTSFPRMVLWYLWLLCVAGVQVFGLDAGSDPARGAVELGGEEPHLLLSYEGGVDEAGLPTVAMSLGWLSSSEAPLWADVARLTCQQLDRQKVGERIWRAASRGPPQ